MSVKQAMVLAAGLGTRMRPLTATRPKPLIEVAGRTLLDRTLDQAAAAGMTRVAVNAHYLADQIDTHCATRTDLDIAVSDERSRLLDSGGGVKAALPLLDDGPLAVLNADTFWRDRATPALATMAEAFDDDTTDMVLLVVPHADVVGFDGAGDFFMDDEGRLTRRSGADHAPFIFAGALITSSSLITAVPEDAFSLNRLFDAAIASGRLRGHVLDGLWLHVGTPEAIGLAEDALAAFDRTKGDV